MNKQGTQQNIFTIILFSINYGWVIFKKRKSQKIIIDKEKYGHH